MDIDMGLDLCGDSANTSDNEEKDLYERIFFRKKLISSLKEIKDLSEENIKQEEKLKIYELENEELRKKYSTLILNEKKIAA